MTSGAALPAVLEEIAQVAGLDAAWALARARGGTTVFLPKNPGRRHWLTEIVGYEAAVKICRHYRSNHTMSITVPMAARAQRAERWREALDSDMSINETALAMGVHKFTVSRHRRQHRKALEGSQGRLFEED